MLNYYIQNPNYHKEEVKNFPVRQTSTCENMKLANGFIVTISINSVVGLRVVLS